ncbi:hypothetical protein F4677DRAFT_46475 [Hypoxylon crocopeplum]|nr:hypothetical protein F4677DRAFT_46475 [Hypoxylon crocopeplum]
MLFSVASSLATVALVGQAIAEPLRQPYKLKLARMSTRSIFGLDRRYDGGYAPEQQYCSDGNTCAEACGKGFEQCASKDGVVHCFKKSGKQTCCPGMTGDSCDKGYFCTADNKGATWCCPDNMTLEQCAAAYNLPGSLVSETQPATSTTKSPSSTHNTVTTAASSVKVVESTTKNIVPVTTSAVPLPVYGTQTSEIAQSVVQTSTSTPVAPVTTLLPASTSVPASVSTSASTSASASPTPPDNGIVQAGSDTTHAPMGVMILFAAAAFAALL